MGDRSADFLSRAHRSSNGAGADTDPFARTSAAALKQDLSNLNKQFKAKELTR